MRRSGRRGRTFESCQPDQKRTCFRFSFVLVQSIHMKHSTILLFLLGIFPLIGLGCSANEEEDINYEDDVFELIEEIDEEYKIRGSCNAIDTHSTCVDYVGSYWGSDIEYMRLNCAGAGTFSENTCPYSELGGCRVAPDTIFETIAWSYDYGGQAISEEEAGYQAMACNALVTGQWTTPDALFLSE